jgi:hypothetical protein
MAVRGSGMRGVFATLAHRKNCFLVKSLMCCSKETGVTLIEVRSTPCVILGKENAIDSTNEQVVCHGYSLKLVDLSRFLSNTGVTQNSEL